jgi:hypothetical protein
MPLDFRERRGRAAHVMEDRATWRISSLTSPTGFCTMSPDENE